MAEALDLGLVFIAYLPFVNYVDQVERLLINELMLPLNVKYADPHFNPFEFVL